MYSAQNPALQAGMDARFAIAARHSRLVRILRIAVPAVVGLAMAGGRSGHVGKDEIERMVQRLLGIDQPLRPVDAADAVALALCHLAHAPTLRRVAAR